ncbi:Poly [ADP-ribose] polymerase 9 [Stylophora pistillata]|uniref:Poly [ADP-ribose] polymerase 9 n=1 Tax=Stylophora pistillata TaxID=50429 RepID=A0A2B4SA82_STYPI|nr:Poly [ADP-ribose] polymerase 9 [Stylophora pistillata]
MRETCLFFSSEIPIFPIQFPYNFLAAQAAVHATVIFSAPDKNVNKRIEVVQNDLTKENVDAIVNAANSWLKHGGGVAGAIVKNGGYQIQTESDEYVAKHGPIKTGGIAVTKPGNLPCNIIIHAVVPPISL